MENLSRVFEKQKQTNKKITHEEIEFHNSVQDCVLLPFIGCRKVIGKMTVCESRTNDLKQIKLLKAGV